MGKFTYQDKQKGANYLSAPFVAYWLYAKWNCTTFTLPSTIIL
jgi:hypothetical protein